MRLIAFYLPQFHPIPENDLWWGRGFTEWTNVTRAVPRFPGHRQPRLPADLGFYDLRLPEARQAQADLAAAYGIHGFCYHHYWFSGRRLLERPLEDVLASGQPRFPFCISWANENWTRRWDGSEDQLLMRQEYSDENDLRFIHDLVPALRDDRYIRVNGRPLLLVYYSTAMPDSRRTTAIWRERAHALGVGELYLVRAETHMLPDRLPDPRRLGFDAAVEFTPHATEFTDLRAQLLPADASFAGRMVDYGSLAKASLGRRAPAYPLHRTLVPDWDNTPRRKDYGALLVGSTPARYEAWLRGLADWTRHHHRGEEQLLFVNAWNEWGEGCCLEPDRRYGTQYLDALRAALERGAGPADALCAMPRWPTSLVSPPASVAAGI